MHGIYRIKVMLRDWTGLFWSLAFPIFLGLIFYFMFGGIAEREMFQEIPLGIVTRDAQDTEFEKLASEVTMEGGKNMFLVTAYAGKEEALDALEGGDIRGIVDLGADYALTFKDSSTDTALIKTFVCHASNYSSHLRQLYRRLNSTSPIYCLS